MRITIPFILLVFLSITLNLVGQNCDCLKNMDILQQSVEKNQASYQHQVVENNRITEYLAFKNEVNAKAKTLSSNKDCIGLISYYLSFFRDEHSFISYTDNSNVEPNIRIKSKYTKNTLKHDPFEGIWYLQDGSFSIELIPVKTSFGEWIAVMHNDQSKKWKKGQLKIEFFKDENDSVKCIYWKQNLIPKTYNVIFTDSTMKIGRNLTFYRKVQDYVPVTSMNTDKLLFTSLSNETNYLKISSFDLSEKNRIDSLIARNKSEIVSKKNLIIDIRNNGGGGFDAFKSLLPFVLDTNVIESPYYGSVWVSKDNYDYYDATKYEYIETKQDSINELNYIQFLEKNLGHFTPIETAFDTLTLPEKSPLNIGILFNKNSASSTEGFILFAKTSTKVKTFGENSAGAVTYGDWMPIELPDLAISVAITTKKMIFKNNEYFESIGIAPDINLTAIDEDDWVKSVLNQLEE